MSHNYLRNYNIIIKEVNMAPLLTFNIFSLIDVRTQSIAARKADAMDNKGSMIYNRPFLIPFIYWCREHFYLGNTWRYGPFSSHIFGDAVSIQPAGTFVLPLEEYSADVYDTVLSENGSVKIWLEKFLTSGVDTLENFHKVHPYVAPPHYKKGEYNPPLNSHYSQIAIPRELSMPYFVGREGFHLKRITELSQCEYVWFDAERHVVEIWGRERKLSKAQRMLERRIASLMSLPPPPPPPLPTEPRKYIPGEFDIPANLTVLSWESYPRKVLYQICGSEALCMQFYTGKIALKYPSNPYFTKIETKTTAPNGVMTMIVTRLTSCD